MTTPTFESIRAKLAALEAQAAARRERDAERERDIDQPATHEQARPTRGGNKGVDAGATWMVAHGRNWLSEAREDLARVEMAPKGKTRQERPATAPEYASVSDALQRETETNRTDPATKAGGNADVPAAGKHEDSQRRGNEGAGNARAEAAPDIALAGQGAKSPAPISELRDAGRPTPAAVPAASEARTGEGAKCPLPASGAATHGVRKLPQARAEHWTVRRDRIDDRILRASLVPSMPFAGPWDDAAPVQPEPKPAARSGRGPPGW